jgi:hypothetical protein
MILLIPVLALFTGSVTLTSSCAKMTAAGECGGTSRPPGKCMLAASHRGCSGQVGSCGHKCNKGHAGKGEQKGMDGGECCMDCPLCYLVTFQPFFQLEDTRQVTMIDYTVMSDNNLSDYFQQHWKPPKVFLLS